jgi:Tfp pilus assembly protein PilX
MKLFPHNKKRGFTLLLAALIASIVLSLGSSIFLIAQKQVALSALGRDSQFAFYAADTGAECALYWDLRFGVFSTTTSATPTCDGKLLSATGKQQTPPYTVEFKIDLFVNGLAGAPANPGYCADVFVHKNTSNPYTVIHADGYSVPCETLATGASALQRSVELHY